MKRVIIFFCILIIVSGMSFAIDFTSFPSSIQPGNMFISGSFDMGNAELSFYESGFANISTNMFGFSIVFDYALDRYCLTVGAETGHSNGSFKIMFFNIDFGVLPIIGRLGYHPNLGVENLDVYALLKLGFAFGEAGNENRIGFGLGIGIGARYFFMYNLGAFLELGTDNYNFKVEGGTIIGRKIFSLGITYKI